jgi:dethiobiotin synthetase
MPEAFFLTGTDTGVGKTLVAAALLHAARARGLRTIGLKPVASGCDRVGERLHNADALALMAGSSESLAYADVNPVALEPAIAPHFAARDVGRVLDAGELVAHCRRQLQRPYDLAVIEGAGGWRVPLDDRATLADVARGLGLPVILVVGIRLGCINHALLSAEAVRNDGLRLAAWVANQVDPDTERAPDIVQTLRERLGAPCLGRIGHLRGADPREAARSLDIALLLGRD